MVLRSLSLGLMTGVTGRSWTGGGSSGDPARYMFMSGSLQPFNTNYAISSGNEYCLSRSVEFFPAYGGNSMRVCFSNWYLTQTGSNPTESYTTTDLIVDAVYARHRGVYYQCTFELMRSATDVTVDGPGTGFTITGGSGHGLNCWTDPLPFTGTAFEPVHIEVMTHGAIGDKRPGGHAVRPWRGESVEYSATTLAAKLGNGTVLNDTQTGNGIFVFRPTCAVCKGWDGRPVGFLVGHSIWDGVGGLTEAVTAIGATSGAEIAFSELQLPYWNRSVLGWATKTYNSSSLDATGRSKQMFDLLGNSGSAPPFTVGVFAGDVNDVSGGSSLATLQGYAATDCWPTFRSLYPSARLVQETSTSKAATTDATIAWTSQANQVPNSSPASTWTAGGIRDQLNDWYLTRVGVGSGPDAILDTRAIYSEQADYTLFRTTFSGAVVPAMSDGTVFTTTSGSISSLLIQTSQRPADGADVVLDVGGFGGAIQVMKTVYRPDQGADVFQVFLAGGSTAYAGGTTSHVYTSGQTVKEEPSIDGLHYSSRMYAWVGQKIKDQSSVFGTMPAIIPGYQTEASDFFDRLAVSITSDQKAAINNLIMGFKAAGIWAQLDGIWPLWLVESNAVLNMKSSSFTLTKSGTVTFSNGATSNGTTGYLDTGINWGVTSTNAVQDSAMLGVFCLSNNAAENKTAMGNSNNALNIRHTTNFMNGRLNAGAGAVGVITSTLVTNHGLAIVNRLVSASIGGYKNGVLGTTLSQTSAAMDGGNITILKGASGFCNSTLGLAMCGASLSAGGMQTAAYRYTNRLFLELGIYP
jgi:hypothetical protein